MFEFQEGQTYEAVQFFTEHEEKIVIAKRTPKTLLLTLKGDGGRGLCDITLRTKIRKENEELGEFVYLKAFDIYCEARDVA